MCHMCRLHACDLLEYTNEGGMGEGTLCNYPHGSVHPAVGDSWFALGRLCNFWRARGDCASYLSTYVMDVTFTRAHGFLLYCSKLGCASLRQNAALVPITPFCNLSLHIPHAVLKWGKVTTYFFRVKMNLEVCQMCRR